MPAESALSHQPLSLLPQRRKRRRKTVNSQPKISLQVSSSQDHIEEEEEEDAVVLKAEEKGEAKTEGREEAVAVLKGEERKEEDLREEEHQEAREEAREEEHQEEKEEVRDVVLLPDPLAEKVLSKASQCTIAMSLANSHPQQSLQQHHRLLPLPPLPPLMPASNALLVNSASIAASTSQPQSRNSLWVRKVSQPLVEINSMLLRG